MSYDHKALTNLNKYINRELPVRTFSGKLPARSEWEKEQLRYFDVIEFEVEKNKPL
jgi:hypothetical protein